ncbi:MAG: DUF1295 domain-containing protein [Verrucomicrobia bacterium]|nr:DUF1295 domain-containing protein [Verrucomicrobiota bacterium]
MLRDISILLPAGLALSLALMLVAWVMSRRMKNAGIVDVFWAGGFFPLVGVYAFFAGGDPSRRLLIAFMVSLWSLRLATHLYFRVTGSPREDARYTRLREKWGPDANRKMFSFFLLQGVLQTVLSIPFLVICTNGTTPLKLIEWAGFIVWLGAFVGETVADWQLSQFKSDPDHHGRICREGLWRFSRHPNYFFELMVWVGWFITGLTGWGGLAMIFAPLLMWHFLTKLTGIPATEEQAIRSKGEAYRRYQETTNKFLPWFPRE